LFSTWSRRPVVFALQVVDERDVLLSEALFYFFERFADALEGLVEELLDAFDVEIRQEVEVLGVGRRPPAHFEAAAEVLALRHLVSAVLSVFFWAAPGCRIGSEPARRLPSLLPCPSGSKGPALLFCGATPLRMLWC